MRNFFASRPSPAMAVAFVALLAALSGTAVALPRKNTVDSGDIKNKQVKGTDLASNAVTAKKVKDKSLTGADIKDDSLTGSDVNEGSLGTVPSATNATNATDAAHATNADQLGGTAAASYLHSFHQVTAVSTSDSTSPKSVTAHCDFNELALGGSGGVTGGTNPENMIIQETSVSQQSVIAGFLLFAGFTATGLERMATTDNWSVTARVTCAKAG